MRFFFESEGELFFAGEGGVVEDRGFTATFGCLEKHSLLGLVGESGKAGLAGGVGSDLQIQLVEVHETVCDVDADFCVVDRRTGGILDGEVGGAGAEASVDDGNSLWIDGRGSLGVES